MHKPVRFIIKCKPSVNLCNISIWVSIHIYLFFYIFVYLFFYLPIGNYNIITIIINYILL